MKTRRVFGEISCRPEANFISTSKFDIKKFECKDDFNLWKEKIFANFGNLGLDEALKGEAHTLIIITEKRKPNVLKKVRNKIVSKPQW